MLLKETIGRAVTVAGGAWFLDVETSLAKVFFVNIWNFGIKLLEEEVL